MTEEDPQKPPPAYYPKAVLKAAIGELIKMLKELRGQIKDGEYRSSLIRKIDAMIEKHGGKEGT